MEKLVVFILYLLTFLSAQASEVVLLGQLNWSTKEKIQKTRFGGISGITFRDDKIFMVSDDRGQINEPRIYEFQIKKDKKIWKLENPQVHFLNSTISFDKKKILDLEAISALPNGNFLISSEGDNNKKPRVAPRIFEITPTGEIVQDLLLPPRVIPESTGQQKMGIGNNFGFEAMTSSADGQEIFFISERPLVQDTSDKNEMTNFRFYQMKRPTENEGFISEKLVQGPPPPTGNGVPLIQGFSEILMMGDKRFLALDRTLKVLGSQRMSFECRLVELDLNQASDTSKVENLSEVKNLEPAKMIKIHALKAGTQDLGNCEGMSLGPSTEEYRQTLWIITDNNFSKSEDTVLYFYGVKN